MTSDSAIPAIVPRGAGHQFVVYGDSCSGIPGHIHEATTAAVNRVVAALTPAPEFIVFLGDEVIGLTTDEVELRSQWRYWLETEMAWLDRRAIPLYHTTANHTTYDAMSERVFREILPNLPQNGPPNQRGLSYFVRRDDLLLIVVNTIWTGLGEGRVETEWLAETLTAHADATYKLVFGHHPVFSINGFAGAYQRDIESENGRRFWDILVEHGVLAYFCSHMLAFDASVERGVLQVMTAGAGTKHRMPEESEYLHAVQAVIDAAGLRYQVLDDRGVLRECLSWPPVTSSDTAWTSLAGIQPSLASADANSMRIWRFRGRTPSDGGVAQTLLSTWSNDRALPPLWVGLLGPEMRLGALLAPVAGRSPHLWFGPAIGPDREFDIQFAIHPHLGPGGLLWRSSDDDRWSSLRGASAWGSERLPEMRFWSIGEGQGNPTDRPFRGARLEAWFRESPQPAW
jgi:hypothetical protein